MPAKLGFIELEPDAPLHMLRLAIIQELDDVPNYFVFLRKNAPISSKQEAAKPVTWAAVEGVILIRETEDL